MVQTEQTTLILAANVNHIRRVPLIQGIAKDPMPHRNPNPENQRGERMNSDRVNGAIDEVVGSAKRKAGKLTHDLPLQVEGLAQQLKGTVQNAFGKARDAAHETEVQHDPRV